MNENLEFIIAPLCLGCWVVPLVMFGIVYGVIRSVTTGVAMRGVGEDGIYCAKCKFDVRGSTSWHCSECGAQMDQPISLAWPRGGIIDRQINPPMHPVIAILLYVVSGFAPAVVAVIILGMILPINYTTFSTAEMFPDVEVSANMPFPMYVTFDGERERSWLGGGDFQRLTMIPSMGQSLSIDTTGRSGSLEQQAEQSWATLSKQEGWLPRDIDTEPYREEFVELFVTISSGGMGQAESEANLFIVDRQDYTEPSFHPLFSVFSFVLVIAAVASLVWWALRDSSRNEKAYIEKAEKMRDRFGKLVERNQQMMQAGSERSVGPDW